MKIAATTVSQDIKQNVSISLFKGRFYERISKVANAGFDGIELLVLDPSHLDPIEVLSSVQEFGLTIAAIGTGVQASLGKLTLVSSDPAIEKRALLRAYEIIDFAAACKTPIVTLGSFRGYLPKISKCNRNHFKTILAKLANFAGERKVSIAVEPVNRYENNFMNTANEVIELLDELSYSNLGLLLDTFHMNIEEGSIEKTIESASPFLLHVHIGDSNRLPPGQGHFPFQLMIQSLRSIGYESWLSAELLAKPDPDIAGFTTGEYLCELLSCPCE
ncbi:sugar phosphate isomerase/epimerase family protein [uncultured Sphaerochaeta sp.]|uniref:sugar phosphate isomerase/epimerase family protein n=1 Tax=uncultured Sphaerochaeta sp. TaxID=886478 RepID=UPI002A0A8E81|nr:sugar phosphate isomerase/epimerase family protein [uncultured Sphaerochaeta sp.]